MATQSVRDKMREDQKQQFNVWLPKATAAHLKLLSKRTGLAYPALITDALQALENALSGEPAEPEPAPSAADNELLQRLAALEASSSAWVPAHEQHDFQIDLLRHWQKDFEGRLSALESRLTAQSPEPLPIPSPELNPAEIAVSVAVAAVFGEASLAQSIAPSAVSPELAALIAAIPETEFTGINSERNRKIIELHTQGLGTTQISKALVNANIANSKENSVKYFLEKHGITPNRVK